ncbi:hypothetical protein ACWGQ5_19085 [Streptomyces sp. NPDC055722]
MVRPSEGGVGKQQGVQCLSRHEVLATGEYRVVALRCHVVL